VLRGCQVVQIMCVTREHGPLYAMYTCLALLQHAHGEGGGSVGLPCDDAPFGDFDVARSLPYLHGLHARYEAFCLQCLT